MSATIFNLRDHLASRERLMDPALLLAQANTRLALAEEAAAEAALEAERVAALSEGALAELTAAKAEQAKAALLLGLSRTYRRVS